MIRFVPGAGATHYSEAGCAAALLGGRLTFTGDVETELAWAAAEVTRHLWTFARSMPQWPHWWSKRAQWANTDDFTRVVADIKTLGVQRKWRTMTNRYLVLPPWDYWVMDPLGAPAEVSALINRAECAPDADRPLLDL